MCVMMLGATQLARLFRRINVRNRPVRPDDLGLLLLVDRPEPWRTDVKEAADAFNLDAANLGDSLVDKGDPDPLALCRVVLDLLPDPLAAGTRLSCSSPT